MPLRPTLIAAGLLVIAAATQELAASRALAYANADRFGSPAVAEAASGGGGGRWFTGSVADGYTCEVCHTGAAEAAFAVTTDFQEGYRPGSTHELEVSWPEDATRTGAMLEVLGDGGLPAGALELVDEPTLAAEERCTGGVPAARIPTAPPDRALVGVDACGASRVRVRWTVPAEQRRRVWLHVALVQGDGSGSPEGDATGIYGRAFSHESAPPEDAVVGRGGCAAVPAGTDAHPVVPCVLLLVLALASVRARPSGQGR